MKENNVIFKEIGDLIEKKLKNQSFQFQPPKELSWNITDDELSKPIRNWLAHYESRCRTVLKLAKAFHLRKRSVADTSQTIFDMLPFPLPETQIHRRNDIIRYRTTILRHKNGILLSLKLISLNEDLGEIAGVNQSKLETALIAIIRALMNRDVQGKEFILERKIDVAENIFANTWTDDPVPEEELTEAISRVPDAIFFAVIHAVLAVVMPLLKPNQKPFYFPAIRLSKDTETAREQVQILRSILGAFDFGCAPDNNFPCTLEITLQGVNDIATLERIEGAPVLVNITKAKVQTKLTEIMQQAHCSLNAAGISEHPFQTVPLLVGRHLPPDNAALTFGWDTLEYVDPADVYTLQRCVNTLLECPGLFAEKFNHGMKYLVLYGRSYPETYFLHMTNLLASMLFTNEEYAQAFVRRSMNFVGRIQEQEIEKTKKFQNAIKLLQNLDGYGDVIAASASKMDAAHLGFFYQKSDGRQYILFDPKQDFPRFCKERLGISPTDAHDFQDYIYRENIIDKRTETAKWKDGKSHRFIFIPLDFVCHDDESSGDR